MQFECIYEDKITNSPCNIIYIYNADIQYGVV